MSTENSPSLNFFNVASPKGYEEDHISPEPKETFELPLNIFIFPNRSTKFVLSFLKIYALVPDNHRITN
jgi:hypothetical protein